MNGRRNKPSYQPYDDRRSREKEYTPKPPLFKINLASLAIFGVVFLLGMGIGIGFSSTASFSPKNVASREVIDRSAPNTELCVQFGASAVVSDLRVFLTLNPFNVYVTQPVMQPGCVIRSNNWSVLQQMKAISPEQERACKNRMNTFAFTGSLEASPKISCVYQNDSAGNFFINQPGATGTAVTESDSF